MTDLESILRNTLSMNSETIKDAERKMQILEMRDNFSLEAIRVCMHSEDSHIRLAAAVQLKNYISKSWELESSSNSIPEDILFSSPRGPSEEVRREVRSLLLQSLQWLSRESSPVNRRLADVLTSCTAHVAAFDWPEKWPEVMEHFIFPALHQPASPLANSALSILHEMSGEISHIEVLQLVPHVVPDLVTIFRDTNLSTLSRRKSLDLMRVILDTLDAHDKATRNRIGRQLMEAFFESLVNEICGKVVTTVQDYALHNSGYLLLIQMVATFNKLLEPHTEHMLQVFGPTFLATVKMYEDRDVYSPRDESHQSHDEAVDEEGNVLNLVNLIDYQLGFLRLLLSSLSETAQKNVLPQVFPTLVRLVQATEDQVERWMSDVQQYVREAEPDSCLMSVVLRNRIVDFVEEFHDCFIEEDVLYKAFLTVVAKLMEEISATSDAFVHGNKWRLHEALLYLTLHFHKPIRNADKADEGLVNIVQAYIENVLVPTTHNPRVHPLLRATGMRCFAILSSVLSPSSKVTLWRQMFQMCCMLLVPGGDPQDASALSHFSGSGSSLLCTASLQCLQIMLDLVDRHSVYLSKEEKNELTAMIMENLHPLVLSLLRTMQHLGLPVVQLVLRLLIDLLQMDDTISAQLEPMVTPVVLQVFGTLYQHANLVHLCCMLIQRLCRNPECGNSLQARVLPHLAHLLDTPGDSGMQDIVLQVVLDLVTHIIISGSSVNSVTTEQFLPVLVPKLRKLCAESVDTVVVERAVHCLAVLIALYPVKMLTMCITDCSPDSLQTMNPDRAWVVSILLRCFSPCSSGGNLTWFARGSSLCRALLSANFRASPQLLANFAGGLGNRQDWLPAVMTAVVARLTEMDWQPQWPKEHHYLNTAGGDSNSLLSVPSEHRDPSVLVSALRGCLLIFLHQLYESASAEEMSSGGGDVLPLGTLLLYWNTLTDLRGTPSLLALVMRMWCCYQHILFDPVHVQMNVFTMCALLRHCIKTNDPLLQSILVNGDEVVATRDCTRVQTRSASQIKKCEYQQIPCVVKFFKLLVNEVNSLREASAADKDDSDGDGDEENDENKDEDEEQDDEDEDEDLGNGNEDDEEDNDSRESIGSLRDPCEDTIYKDAMFRSINQLENLTQFFQHMAQQSYFGTVFMQHMNPLERSVLKKVNAWPTN